MWPRLLASIVGIDPAIFPRSLSPKLGAAGRGLSLDLRSFARQWEPIILQRKTSRASAARATKKVGFRENENKHFTVESKIHRALLRTTSSVATGMRLTERNCEQEC